MTQVDELLPIENVEEPAPRRRLGWGAIALLASVVLIAAVFGIALLQRNQGQPTSGAAPDFTVTTLNGSQIRLSDLKGRVVVLNFWASWCGPCRDEAEVLEDIWQRYQDRGVVVLGIAYTDTERNARAFIEEFSQTYPNALDIGTRISDLYNITGVPETFIIDQNGEIAQFLMVAVRPRQLDTILLDLLEEA
ncbi:MAG: TlpA family protein disulfide reductase [Anaerolineae bacterium]|nr:TlpA family protein disulfide reductase [Anaerolineae bacterium]